MLYRVYVIPALPYVMPETSGQMDEQLQPLASAHNAYLRRVTGMGRRPDGTLCLPAQMCAAPGCPQLTHTFNAARLKSLRHVSRMPDGSVGKQLLLLKRWWDWVAGRPRSTWRDRAVAALSPDLSSRTAGWVWFGVAQDCA
eukprot:359188-Chlamydomonas_euryale.AAC.12